VTSSQIAGYYTRRDKRLLTNALLEARDYNGRRVQTVGESVEELDEVRDGGEEVLSCTIVPVCVVTDPTH